MKIKNNIFISISLYLALASSPSLLSSGNSNEQPPQENDSSSIESMPPPTPSQENIIIEVPLIEVIDPYIGNEINGYKFDSQLGKGAFGIVYLIYDKKFY